MNAFFKTLFGDVRNLGVVSVIVAFDAAMAYFGHATAAAYTSPLLLLAGIAWLAVK